MRKVNPSPFTRAFATNPFLIINGMPVSTIWPPPEATKYSVRKEVAEPTRLLSISYAVFCLKKKKKKQK
ncbi:hypothetical protein, partial [Treponema sp. R6D11]